jgi:hypothetical protein
MERFAVTWLANQGKHPVIQAAMAHYELVSLFKGLFEYPGKARVNPGI